MKRTGTLFLNADDHNSKKVSLGNFRGTIVKIGIHNEADYQAYDIRYTERGMSFTARWNNTSYPFYIPIYGSHNVYNALFAIAAADRLGFSPLEIAEGLKRYRKQKGRLVVYRVKNNIRIIDDTFNANPNSVKAAINVLNHVGGEQRILVLGSMSELGRYTTRGHKEVGKNLAKSSVDCIFTFGKHAKIVGTTAILHGYPRESVVHSADRNHLHRKIIMNVKPGTIILVKGSHNMQMNKSVRYLKQNLNRAGQ
jgi:UDP-N-acetylmuramoyl-tripeptide--D-alanyl-D-alanine ligase